MALLHRLHLDKGVCLVVGAKVLRRYGEGGGGRCICGREDEFAGDIATGG